MEERDKIDLKESAKDNVVNVVNNQQFILKKENKFAKFLKHVFVHNIGLKVLALLTAVGIFILSTGFGG